MKGIYKKLSVGVLAVALLVGGSGLVQGGQAFADSQAIVGNKAYNDLDEYLKDSRKLDNEIYGAFIGYCRSSDRRQVVNGLRGKNVELREIDKRDVSRPESYKKYEDGWDFKKDVDELINSMKGKGPCKVNVGELYFIISGI